MAELTQAGHSPQAYEIIRQALIRTYVAEHDPGQNASHVFAYIHDAGLRLVPAHRVCQSPQLHQVLRIDGSGAGDQ